MPNPVIHFEIGCRDFEGTTKFYGELFGWKVTPQKHGAMIDTEAGEGIGGHITSLGHEPHHYVLFYIQVDDLEASIRQAEALGGKGLIPPTEVQGMGHFAWVKDPEDTIFGLWKPYP